MVIPASYENSFQAGLAVFLASYTMSLFSLGSNRKRARYRDTRARVVLANFVLISFARANFINTLRLLSS